MNVIVTFTLWFILAEAILTAAQLPLRKKQLKPAARAGLIVAKALLAILFAFLPMAGPVQLRAAQPFMMALYPALLADAAADTVCSVIFRLREEERRFGLVNAVSLLCGVLFFAYGVANMEIVTPQYHTYTSEKLTQAHTVGFLADLHVGSAQPFSVSPSGPPPRRR